MQKTLKIGFCVMALATAGAYAQPFDVNWHTVDGGGAMFSTGGAYSLGGTIGQPDAGAMAGGSYGLTGGFWALAGAGVPSAVIASANPPATSPYSSGPFRDVLQNTTPGLVPQGIGVVGTPAEGTISFAPVTVSFSIAPSPALAIGNVAVGCTDIAGNGQADCPGMSSISGSGAGPYQIALAGPIPARECLTLSFGGNLAGQKLQYQSLPGDTNLDGMVNTQDILFLTQRINDGAANQAANQARYNINRSALLPPHVNTQDMLRLVQLLNGAGTTQIFNGATVASCP